MTSAVITVCQCSLVDKTIIVKHNFNIFVLEVLILVGQHTVNIDISAISKHQTDQITGWTIL